MGAGWASLTSSGRTAAGRRRVPGTPPKGGGRRRGGGGGASSAAPIPFLGCPPGMWFAVGPSPEGPPGDDAAFTAAVSRRMQVPVRLRLLGAWEGSGASEPEGVPAAALQMQVPDRLCLAEMLEVASRSLSGPWPPSAGDASLDLALQAAIDGQEPFLSLVSSSGAQKRKRPGHLSRARKERVECPMDAPHLAMEAAARQRQDCSREVTLVLESSLEEFGPTDILAMQKQLMRISGRLQALEEQSMGWRQKQLLFYSILVSACVLNMWLWLRR